MKKSIRIVAVLLAVAATAGCAKQPTMPMEAKNEAIRDFIAVRKLESVDRMPATTRDGYKELTSSYLIYRTRRERHLVEFARPCYELRDSSYITPDNRSDPKHIRARFDTIRGCRIHQLYPLTPAEVEELQQIGEPPGSRN